MDIQELQQTLRRFAAERNWQPFHTPKNLAMALMVEAAELQEIYQWMTPEQSQTAHHDAVTKQHIGEEVADVLLYLLQLADHSQLDLNHAVSRKIVKNANKYPPVNSLIPSGKGVTASAPIHVLVDWENVQPKEADILKLVPGATDTWVFHGQNQKLAKSDFASFGDKATLVPITRPGKNALDFHLAFYLGYIASRSQNARIVVISNDKGYGPMLDHAVGLGFSANQLGFVSPKVVAKKTTTPKVVAAKPAEPKLQTAPAKKVSAAQTKPPVQKPAPAKTGQASPSTAQPAAKKSPAQEKAAAPKAGTSAVQKSGASPKAAAKKAVKSTIQPAPTVQPKSIEAPPSKPVKKPQGTTASATAKKTKNSELTLQQRTELVLMNIKKSVNKPARKARLLGTIQSLINVPKDDPQIEAVLNSLLATGEVMLSESGAVTYR